MEKQKTDNEVWVFAGVGFLVILLAIGSFVLSFQAVSQLATDFSMSYGWLFAVMLDSSIVVFSIVRLYATWNGSNWFGGFCLLLIAIFVGLSVWFNVGELSAGVSPLFIAIHALPPLMLLVSFEVGFIKAFDIFLSKKAVKTTVSSLKTAMETLKSEFETKQEQINDDLQQAEFEAQTAHNATTRSLETEKETAVNELDQLTKQRDQLLNEIEKLTAKRGILDFTKRQTEIINAVHENPGMNSYDELAQFLELTKNQVYSPTLKLIEMNVIEKNGHGLQLLKPELVEVK